MSKEMKRTALIMVGVALVLAVILYGLSDSRPECVRRVARAMDLPLTKETVVLTEHQKENSFHGDGTYVAILTLKEDQSAVQATAEQQQWQPYTATDEDFPHWIREHIAQRVEKEYLDAFAPSAHCRYRLIDRLEGTANLTNFTLAVLNLDTGQLLYVEYDS